MMKFEFFYGYDHPLSQWYNSVFIIDDIEFNSAEQWMMFSKAILFEDVDKSREILKEQNPLYQRKLGRQINNFKQEIWDLNKEAIVYKGNFEKFSQNDDLKFFLLDTHDKVLAEASPTDLIWGIGCSINDDRRFKMEKWRGQNLLGIILMKIRDEL